MNYRVDTFWYNEQKRGRILMVQLPIKQWEISHAIRLLKSLLEALEAEKDDNLNAEVINHSIVLTKAEKEVTFEELFKDYNEEKFTTEISHFSPVENEKW